MELKSLLTDPFFSLVMIRRVKEHESLKRVKEIQLQGSGAVYKYILYDDTIPSLVPLGVCPRRVFLATFTSGFL